MSNDISNINSSRPQTTTTQTGTSQGTQSSGSSTQSVQPNQSSGSTDKVSFTSTAEKLKELEKQLSQESPVNEQKVQYVRAAIDNGDYQVDPEKIAEKMIDFESQLEK